MKFSEFLIESKNFDFEKFKTDCEYFLSLLKGTHGMYLMYRGAYDTPNDYRIQTWKERTQPRDSTVHLHTEMNEFFQDFLGAPIRNWTFATGRKEDASIFSPKKGIVSVVFPIGKFEWASADNEDGHDLTGFYDRCVGAVRSNLATKDLPYDEKIDIAIDMMKHKMEKWDWRMNKDFVDCLTGQNEIMFKCDKYYAFNSTGLTIESPEFKEFLLSI